MRCLTVLVLLQVCICLEGCEFNWLQFREKCYMFSKTAATWAEAEGICHAFHSKLAEPRSYDESRMLIHHSVNEGGQFWIGISDIISENRWIYSSDIRPVQVKDFHSGEPNGGTSANCVALWKNFHGYWADEDCHQHYNFICEKSA